MMNGSQLILCPICDSYKIKFLPSDRIELVKSAYNLKNSKYLFYICESCGNAFYREKKCENDNNCKTCVRICSNKYRE